MCTLNFLLEDRNKICIWYIITNFSQLFNLFSVSVAKIYHILFFLNYIDKHFILLYNSCERRKGMGISMTADPSYSENNMRYPEKVISDIDSRKANLAEHNLIEA